MTYKSTSRFPLEVEDKNVKDFTQRKKNSIFIFKQILEMRLLHTISQF